MDVEYNIEKWQGKFKSEALYVLTARTVRLDGGEKVCSDWQHIGDYPRKGDAIAVKKFIEQVRMPDLLEACKTIMPYLRKDRPVPWNEHIALANAILKAEGGATIIKEGA